MTPQPLATHPLDNQLTLEIFDASRRIAADRWQVELVMQIDIPVAEHWFASLEAPAPLAEMQALLGETTRFEYRDRRTFVEAGEKDALLARLQADLLAMAPQYYGHPDFAARYITKCYREKRRTGPLG